MGNKIFKLIKLLIVIALFAAEIANAGNGVPLLMPMQGRLTDIAGIPVSDPSTVNFRIYPPTGGGCYIYEDTQTFTPNAYGVFSVLLGATGNRSFPVAPSTLTVDQIF